jgi:hypothetical protein
MKKKKLLFGIGITIYTAGVIFIGFIIPWIAAMLIIIGAGLIINSDDNISL